MSQYWSAVVRGLTPYVPGEQPKIANLIKLNTNENPYPPSPRVLAAIRHELGDDAARLRLYPDPNADPVVVSESRAAVGICGSDVHYLKHGRIGDFIVNEPMVLGHEASGVVTAVGAKVSHLKVGDRVCMEPGIPDYASRQTLQGLYNLDPEVRFWATPPIHGDDDLAPVGQRAQAGGSDPSAGAGHRDDPGHATGPVESRTTSSASIRTDRTRCPSTWRSARIAD